MVKLIRQSGWRGKLAWLTSMKFSINLLIAVGVVMALGTFIPQGQTPAFYRQLYGGMVGQLIITCSMDTIYQAWWFYLLIALLSSTIIICAGQKLSKAKSLQGAGSLLFHLAIVVTLIGAAWSLGYARSAALEIVEGETVALSQHGFDEGELTLHSFNIDYYQDFQPRQYTSDLSLAEYEGRDYRQQTYVNRPLRAGTLKIYQSNWGWMLQIDDSSPAGSTAVMLKNHDLYNLDQNLALKAVFIPDFAEDEQGIYSQSPLPNNPRLMLTLVENGKMIDARILAVGEATELGQHKLRFKDFTQYSGLLLKEDAGVNLVFLGFGLLMLGLMARYGRLFFEAEGE